MESIPTGTSAPLAVCRLEPGRADPGLAPLFSPRSVALIGATARPGSVGRALLENLAAFPGELYPVNPKHGRVLGRQAWPSLAAVGGPVDLAVIAVPAPQVPQAVRECVACRVGAAIIISAGFKETGEAGRALEAEVLAEARRNGLRLIGPNCLGVMMPHTGLNATFATAMARPGRVAFLSQSGALCTAVLDWSLGQNVGFSAFVSVGSMLDVGWGDLVRHFGDDQATESIVIYMESVGDAAAFMDAARQVAARKPLVVIKVGRTEAAARAAASHTGAMTGSDAVLDAAFERAGVLRVDTIEELFDMAEVLSKQPLPAGPRLAILTNAGGPGALATDALVQGGGIPAALGAGTLERLNACLPPHWSHANPVDVLGDADAGRYTAALDALEADPDHDGLLVVLTPQAMTDPQGVARALAAHPRAGKRPVLASWMGGQAVEAARQVLNNSGIPTYDYPDEAARAFHFMWQRHERLGWLAETNRLACAERPAMTAARDLVARHQQAGRGLLTEAEAKEILAAAGIPVVPTRAARTEAEAVQAAAETGFPVVLKLLSPTLTHKTDVGGVCLDLGDADAVRAAWARIQAAVPAADFSGVTVQPMVHARGTELILGATRDAQFGPVLLFGAGGIWVEVLQDRVLALPPLSPALALDRMRRTRIWKALRGTRRQPAADVDAVAQVLATLGDLMLACPDLVEVDINPLLATPGGALALDARMVLAQDSGAGPD